MRASTRYHQPEWLITQTMNQTQTLGSFLDSLLRQAGLSNRTVAFEAGVSESVIRNLLQYGLNPAAKNPDPRTLRAVAACLGVDPLHLFRLAGYLDGPPPGARSARAEYLASAFDAMLPDHQEVLLDVLGTLIRQTQRCQAAQSLDGKI